MAPSVQLWDPATTPVDARGGAGEGKAGAAGDESKGMGEAGGGGGGDQHGGPAFESILIFGGIGSSAVVGVRRDTPQRAVYQKLFCVDLILGLTRSVSCFFFSVPIFFSGWHVPNKKTTLAPGVAIFSCLCHRFGSHGAIFFLLTCFLSIMHAHNNSEIFSRLPQISRAFLGTEFSLRDGIPRDRDIPGFPGTG